MKTARTQHARTLAAAILIAASAHGAHAEKADRGKPMVVEADQPGTIDLQRQVVVFSGNVVITQGTLSLRADRIEVRESADGQRSASATGTASRPASYRQKRDGVDEWVEGRAERIEYDTRSDTLRLSGGATMRRLRGSTVADEITGGSIVWNNAADLFTVSGGAPTAANPAGRVRAVLAPRAAAAASSPADALPLLPSRQLGGAGR